MTSPLFSPFVLLYFIRLVSALSLAEPVFQNLDKRVYNGGWPLGTAGSSSTCPAVAPVTCGSSVKNPTNPACCPSGQTCFTNGDEQYCCPSDTDCSATPTDFLSCADPSWVMFSAGTNFQNIYFCCLPSQLGVNPLPDASTYGGLCEPSDQAVPTSLIATVASQYTAGGPSPTAPLPTCVGGGDDGDGPCYSPPLSKTMKIIVAVVGILGALLVIGCFGCCCCMVWRVNKRQRRLARKMQGRYRAVGPQAGTTEEETELAWRTDHVGDEEPILEGEGLESGEIEEPPPPVYRE